MFASSHWEVLQCSSCIRNNASTWNKVCFWDGAQSKASVTMWRPGECIIIHNIYIWAISKTLGSRNGHPQIWKGAIVYHPFAQKWYMANLRGIACRKNCCNDLPDSGAEAVLPSWSGIFAAGLWAIWGGATGRGALQISFSPPSAWTASLWASHLYTATL